MVGDKHYTLSLEPTEDERRMAAACRAADAREDIDAWRREHGVPAYVPHPLDHDDETARCRHGLFLSGAGSCPMCTATDIDGEDEDEDEEYDDGKTLIAGVLYDDETGWEADPQ